MMINEAKPPALQHVDNILEKHMFSELPTKKKKKKQQPDNQVSTLNNI